MKFLPSLISVTYVIATKASHTKFSLNGWYKIEFSNYLALVEQMRFENKVLVNLCTQNSNDIEKLKQTKADKIDMI